jgi:hypothetical protein
MYAEIGGYYAYNLYDECAGKRIFREDLGLKASYLADGMKQSLLKDNFFRVDGALNDYPCPGMALSSCSSFFIYFFSFVLSFSFFFCFNIYSVHFSFGFRIFAHFCDDLTA